MKAEEWLIQQQLFRGVEQAVVSQLAQACRSEDTYKGQIIQDRGQKVQDLLILREGHAKQDGLPNDQGGQALSCNRHALCAHHDKLLAHMSD